MKIICQACQSKYTIADDKIQGKVAKIRCRKCGATVLVDASGGGARSNGSTAAAASGEVWLVSVADGDQRTLHLHEVVDAYNSGAITGATYLWKEGMGDWQPLSDVAEIIDALNQANAAAGSPSGRAHEDYQAPAAYSPPATSYTPPSAYSPPAVAARRETARGRGDLFGGAAAEEEVATSAPPQASARGGASSSLLGGGGASAADSAQQRSGLTGARDEHSVLFSLSALTNTAKPGSMPPMSGSASGARSEDSGLIDLNALARSQQQARAAEAPPAPLATPFLFPAALGNVETFHTPETQKKSSMPMIIGGGLAVAGVAIALAIFAGAKKEESPPLPAAPTVSAAAPEPAPVQPAAAEPPPAESAPAASAKVAAKKVGGSGPRPNKPSAAPGGAPAAPALPPPTPKAKSPCGCAGGDLQCQIRCSAMGK
jgi:predicted Zn finger-like uncharacterized protein